MPSGELEIRAPSLTAMTSKKYVKFGRRRGKKPQLCVLRSGLDSGEKEGSLVCTMFKLMVLSTVIYDYSLNNITSTLFYDKANCELSATSMKWISRNQEI